MKPYIITSMALYYRKRYFLAAICNESHILTKSLEITKERILDTFSMMKDKPVDVELKIKYI